jgi:hypothetical protein
MSLPLIYLALFYVQAIMAGFFVAQKSYGLATATALFALHHAISAVVTSVPK